MGRKVLLSYSGRILAKLPSTEERNKKVLHLSSGNGKVSDILILIFMFYLTPVQVSNVFVLFACFKLFNLVFRFLFCPRSFCSFTFRDSSPDLNSVTFRGTVIL